MKRFLKETGRIVLMGLIILTPLSLALAAPDSNGSNSTGGINNPLGSVSNIPDLIFKIFDVLASFVFVVLVFFFVYAGFMFVTAQGSEEKIKTAKKIFQYTVIGAALVLGGEVIANFIQGTINQIKS